MGIITTQVNWKQNLAFEGDSRGHKTPMDVKDNPAGLTLIGPTPKELLLMSICGCSGMDVVSLLKKMRVEFDDFEMQAESETTEGYPAVFKKVYVKYIAKGVKVDPEKLIKSVTMSMTKYCGVSAMVSKACPIEYQIYINENLIHTDLAKFDTPLI